MPKPSRGCSPESAQRIMDLLFQESSGAALIQLNQSFHSHTIAPRRLSQLPTAADPTRIPRKRGGLTKITPDVIAFVHEPANRSLTIPEIAAAIQEKFGITMVSSTIYKVWKMTPPVRKGSRSRAK